MQAVQQLPGYVRERAVFYLVGQNTSRMAGEIRETIEDIPEIVMTGMMGRKEIFGMLARTDVLVCPSREDPMPTVAAEAMMCRVPCLVSDATGTASYIEPEENGMVFPSGDVRELAEKICWCVEHYDRLGGMGERARRVYEERFSMSVFEKRVRELL